MAKKQGKEKKTTGNVFEWGLMKRMISYLGPYKGWFSIAFGLTILLSLLMPVRPFLFQYMLDNPVVAGDMEGLRLLVMAVLALLFVQTIIGYFNTYLTNWLGQSVMRDLRTQVFDHILRLRLKYYDTTPIGTLQTRTISDVETLNNVFSSGLVRILGDLLQIFAVIGTMFYISWRLTLVVLITVPILLVATYIFKTKVKAAFEQVRKSVSRINAFLQEHITGMPIVHIFNREQIEYDRFDEINDKLQKANLNSVLYYSVFFPVVEMVSALGLALIVWYGVGAIMEGFLTFGKLVAFTMYISMFFRPIRMLADQFNTLQLGMVSAERIFKVLDTQDFIKDEGQNQEVQGNHNQLSIRLEDVSFAYNEPEWVLQDINLDIQPGEKVALVGSTGSGKTTIINLISRFYEVQKGNLFINDTNIKEFELAALRSLIGVVLQDVFLFSGSIYDNISLNNSTIPMETIVEAAKKVGANEFISQLPGGYNYHVRERGATLSLGQRQLVAFARVMVYNPSILVLDEATANIDTESEEIIQKAIDTVMADRTSIMIAHRLSTIQKADKIVVLHKGKIIEVGNHHELMEQKGAYFRLHELQFAHH